jgi:hypothetical protein
MYARKEAMFSCQVEGTQRSVQDVVAAEARIFSPEPTRRTRYSTRSALCTTGWKAGGPDSTLRFSVAYALFTAMP